MVRVLGFLACALAAVRGTAPQEGTAFLVESIPLQQDEIRLTEGARDTWELLTTYANEATDTIDLTAMYWDMLAENKKGAGNFTEEQFLAFGAQRGRDLYGALDAAAARGVRVRALCGTGITGTAEVEEIQKRHPENVAIQIWDADAWYEGGIMHQKIWIFDGHRVYLGSANMDWLSLTQVKEMGIAAEGDKDAGFALADDMQSLFNRWWQWTATDGTPARLVTAMDSSIQQARKVPCWEQEPAAYEASPDACQNPFSEEDTTSFNFQHPMSLQLNGSQSQSFVSCSPPAICDAALASNAMYGRAPEGREWDGNALIRTILSAKESVDLSVMDFIPSTLYMDAFPPSYWAGLTDALIAKVRQGARVRMLISKWGSSKDEMWRYLNALQALADACLDTYNPCVGSLEIRQFALPGWDKTKSSGAEFPPFSRVNHAKYIVTDNRFNIGTSNMAWSYFYNTAGASFNSDHPALRSQLQSAFSRDWASSYASALEPIDAQLI